MGWGRAPKALSGVPESTSSRDWAERPQKPGGVGPLLDLGPGGVREPSGASESTAVSTEVKGGGAVRQWGSGTVGQWGSL